MKRLLVVFLSLAASVAVGGPAVGLRPADNAVYHGAAHVSSIVVPIVARPAPATQAAGR